MRQVSNGQLLAYFIVHQKIVAIKAVRQAFDFRLKRSKELVESIMCDRPLLVTYEQLGKLTAAISLAGEVQHYDYTETPPTPVNRGPGMTLRRIEGVAPNLIDLQQHIDENDAERTVEALA
jgi:hypothetical protein